MNPAAEAFRNAVKLRPNDPIPHLRLALLLDQQGERAVARPIYEQVLKIEPDNAVALNNVAYMMAEGGEDLDQALALAQRAKQKLPENLDVADTLAGSTSRRTSATTPFRSTTTCWPSSQSIHLPLSPGHGALPEGRPGAGQEGA